LGSQQESKNHPTASFTMDTSHFHHWQQIDNGRLANFTLSTYELRSAPHSPLLRHQALAFSSFHHNWIVQSSRASELPELAI
jgi:hypothetical protein